VHPDFSQLAALSKKTAFKKIAVPTNMAFCSTVACSGKVTVEKKGM